MRISLFLVISLLLLSCQTDIDDDDIHLKKIAAFDIDIPENLAVNIEHTISFKYALANGCETFYDIEYEVPNENVRIITAFAEVANNQNCTQEYREESFSFKFKPNQSRTYNFKFWIRQNNQGVDEFEEYELVVD